MATTERQSDLQPLDDFIADMSEVLGVPERKIKELFSQLEEEPEVIQKSEVLCKARSSKKISSTHAA